MKTLVIHPTDSTTTFLSEIYRDKDNWTILNEPNLRPEEVITAIQEHDRVIMCGHGSPQGLFGGWYGFLVDSLIVPFLKKKKEIICIWCNADQFVKEHDLKPVLYTGMFISEVQEAEWMGVEDSDEEKIEDSNYLFAESINAHIDSDNFFRNVVKDYDIDDDVVVYNRNRLYFA
jgi:hypothetical protein